MTASSAFSQQYASTPSGDIVKRDYLAREARSTQLTRAVPADLLGLAQWVCWRYEMRDDKRTKVPYNAVTGKRADSTKPATWTTFTQARDAYLRDGHDGLGFVFAGELVGIDVDDCRDAETGALAEWARPLLALFAGCYMEISPSGTGVHIILHGTLPSGGNRTPYASGVVEMYNTGRFFTMTGDLLGECGATANIETRQRAIETLHGELFPNAKKQRGPRPEPRPVSLDDAALLKLALTPNTGAGRDLLALWRGDISAYGDDDSRADFNLARHLVFWTGGDAPRIERLMRSSALVRDKWDEKSGKYDTYLLRTIDNAISASSGRYYSGAQADSIHCQVVSGSQEAPDQETSAVQPSKDDVKTVAQLRRENEQLRRELTKARARIKELEQAQRWERKLRANKHISATTKAVLAAANEHYAAAKELEGTHLRMVYLPAIAKAAGVSERTVSTTLRDAKEKMGACDKETRPEVSTRSGKLVDRTFYAPAPVLLEKPEALKPETPRNHGGKRVCPECGSRHLRVRIRAQVTCLACGNKWETVSAERILRGDEEEMTAKSDAMLAAGTFLDGQVDGGSSDENCAVFSQREDKDAENSAVDKMAAAPAMNHRDERAEVLALVAQLPNGWRTRIPVGLNHNEGGTAVRWQTFTAQADNVLIDEALRQLKIRAAAYAS